jgi:hypothetical protein
MFIRAAAWWAIVAVWALAACPTTPARGAQVSLELPNRSGNDISLLFTGSGSSFTLGTGIPQPGGVTFFDGFTNAHQYSTSVTAGAVYQFNSGGGNATPVVSGLNGPSYPLLVNGTTLYVSNFGTASGGSGGGGTSVAKITLSGFASATNFTTTADFATGLNSPAGLAFDPSTGILYEADFGSNTINKIDTASGAVTNFVPASAGLSRPSAIALNGGTLYVTNFGDATGSGGSVSMISSAGAVTNNFITGLDSPMGIVIDPGNGTFYVDSFNQGTVSHVLTAGGVPIVVGSAFSGPTQLIIVPEPSSFAIASLAAVGAAILARRRCRHGIRQAR